MSRQLTCPGCAGAMIAGDVGGVELDTCPGCRGLWLDGGEWARVFGRRPETRHAGAPARLTCPACAAEGVECALHVFAIEGDAGVEVDACARCQGAFLDAGEMQALRAQRRAQRRAPRPAPSRERREESDGPESNDDGPGLGGLVAAAATGLGALASRLVSGDAAPPSRGLTPPPLPSNARAGGDADAGNAPDAGDAPGAEPQDTTLRFHCAQCGGPVDAAPDDRIVDCPFCGSWSALLRAKVADACAVDCPELSERELAACWIDRRIAIYKAELVAQAQANARREGNYLAAELAERQAEAMARRERERLKALVTIGERRLLQVPYLHEHADGYQMVLGRESGGDKLMAVVGFVAEATEPAYDTKLFDFRDRGLRLHRGRLRLLTAKDVAAGFEGLPVADPKGVAGFSVNRERVKPQQQRLSDLARVGELHGRRREIVYKPMWIAEIRLGDAAEWNLIDGQTGVVAGAVQRSDELQRLLEPPGDSPFLEEWEAKAVLVPHRCPECGQDLDPDRQAWFRPCTNCHTGLARDENGLSRLSYSHVEIDGGRADWFPAWRFRFASPEGHEDLRGVREGLGARNAQDGPPQPFVWVPARRLLGGLPGDRAFQRVAENLHHRCFEVVDEPLPPVTQGTVLGATLDAEQAEALARAAVAASFTKQELARTNAALARKELFGTWRFREPRLVLLPGRVLTNGNFQLAAANWPIPARLGGLNRRAGS